MQSAGCRVQSAECRVQSAECRVQSAECRVQGAGCRVQGADCKYSSMKTVRLTVEQLFKVEQEKNTLKNFLKYFFIVIIN